MKTEKRSGDKWPPCGTPEGDINTLIEFTPKSFSTDLKYFGTLILLRIMPQIPANAEKRDLFPENFKNICSISLRAVTKIIDF